MKNFGRALADALGFWPLLLVATLCSVGGGAIWGLNIGALFPVVEVTIAGESLQDWIQDEIAESHQRIAELENQIDDTRKGAGSDLEGSQLKIELLQTRLDAEKAGLKSLLRFEPYINRYLPHNPMQTILYVMGGLILLTALKHVFQYVNTLIVALIAARITRRIQKRIFAKAMGLDQASFANYGSSGFVAHITYTTTMLSNGITSV